MLHNWKKTKRYRELQFDLEFEGILARFEKQLKDQEKKKSLANKKEKK
jgi:hypothetical protein